MDDSSLPTPLPFIRNRRQLRALLIDDQVWFILADFCRLISYTHEQRMAHRLSDDQVREERLRTEDDLVLDYLLVSESGVYQALTMYNQNHTTTDALRRWISGTVVPQVRSQFTANGPRHVQLQFDKQCVGVLDWQDQLWVSFGDLPRVLGRHAPTAGHSGWRAWARRLRT